MHMLEIIHNILAVIGGMCLLSTFLVMYICCQWHADDELIEELNRKEENDEV